ncbi:MAG: metal ABC transporter permease [Gaiellaceae bacterium]
MLSQDFIRLALLAGTPIALASGAIGYFVVLGSQVFAGETLSHVAFTGALAAAAIGVDLRVGLFAATIAVALLLATLGERAMSDDVAIGTVLAWILGLGAFFLDLFNRSSDGGNGIVATRTLFGSIFGLSRSQAELAAAIGAGLVLALAAIARPLLFATIDPKVAAARGLPVAALGASFLALVGVDAALTTQVIGALLMLGLIAVPAGAAHRLTANTYLALTLSSLFAVASLWLGIAFAYIVRSLPPSSAIIGVAATIYLLSFLGSAPRRLRPARAGQSPAAVVELAAGARRPRR